MMEVLNNIQRQTEAEVAEIKKIENGKCGLVTVEYRKVV